MNKRKVMIGRVVLIAIAAVMFQDARAQQSPQTAQSAPVKLTLHDAEQLATTKHPRIKIAHLNALAAKEIVRETRAALLLGPPEPVIAGFWVTDPVDVDPISQVWVS